MYSAILLLVFLFIITIIISILITISLDNIFRLPLSTTPVNNDIVNNFTSLGSIVIIFLIFIITLELICGILAYYYTITNYQGDLLTYLKIVLIIFIFGTLILEIYTYYELKLFITTTNDIDIITSSHDYFLWAIGLTVLLFIFSLILIFI